MPRPRSSRAFSYAKARFDWAVIHRLLDTVLAEVMAGDRGPARTADQVPAGAHRPGREPGDMTT